MFASTTPIKSSKQPRHAKFSVLGRLKLEYILTRKEASLAEGTLTSSLGTKNNVQTNFTNIMKWKIEEEEQSKNRVPRRKEDLMLHHLTQKTTSNDYRWSMLMPLLLWAMSFKHRWKLVWIHLKKEITHLET